MNLQRIRTVTELNDPRIARFIKDHVAAGTARWRREGDGLAGREPGLACDLQEQGQDHDDGRATDRGSIVAPTSSDPETVAVLQKHALEVSDLVRGGARVGHGDDEEWRHAARRQHARGDYAKPAAWPQRGTRVEEDFRIHLGRSRAGHGKPQGAQQFRCTSSNRRPSLDGYF